MPNFPLSSVTGAELSAVLDMHASTSPESQFRVCACGSKSLDVNRPRHLIDAVRKHTGAVLVPTPLLGNPSAHALALLDAVCVDASVAQHRTLMPLIVTAQALHDAYGFSAGVPELDHDDLVHTLARVLTDHRMDGMSVTDAGAFTALCACGKEVEESAFEAHRAAASTMAGCVFATRSEIHGVYRALTILSDNIPASVLRRHSEDSTAMFSGIARLRSRLNLTGVA